MKKKDNMIKWHQNEKLLEIWQNLIYYYYFFIFCIKPLTFGLQKWPSEMQPGLVHTEIFLPPIQLVQAGILIASR